VFVLVHRVSSSYLHPQWRLNSSQLRADGLLASLSHGVEGRAVLEPLDLALVECVRELDVEGLVAVGGVDDEGNGLADGELSSLDVDLVVRADLLVVGGLGEGQGQHTLLLQVGLVDTSEGAGDDGKTAQVPGLKGSVLTGRTLAVVPVTDNDPPDAVLLVITGNVRDGTVLAGEVVLDLVGLAVLLVDGTDQHVVGDVVQVATVLQPGTSHRDVVSGGLALALDEDGQVGSVLAVPSVEGRQELETVGRGGDGDLDGLTVRRRSLVGVVSWVVAVGRETSTCGLLELELLAVGILQGVGLRNVSDVLFLFLLLTTNQGVEVKCSSNGERDNEIGGGDERVGCRLLAKSFGRRIGR
jgi:hypothetical protein